MNALGFFDPDEDLKPKRKPISVKAKEDSMACKRIIIGYRNSLGYDKYGRDWNDHHFPILMKTAKAMLDLFGNWQDSVNCIDDTVTKIKEWNPDAEISLQGIFAKHAFRWKMDKFEREAKSPEVKII